MERSSRPPIPVAERIEAFLAVVNKRFAFLGRMDYKGPKIVYEKDPLLPNWTRAVYTSVLRRREVDWTFLPGEPEDGSDDKLLLTIWRLPADGEQGPAEDLVFHLFLAKYRPDFDLSLLRIDSFSGGYSDRIDRVLGLYSEILQREARGILCGIRWEKGFYPSWV